MPKYFTVKLVHFKSVQFFFKFLIVDDHAEFLDKLFFIFYLECQKIAQVIAK